jgi:hypothetical protein
MPGSLNANLYRSIILEDSPTVFWECNETTGTTFKDISGHGNDGTLTGTGTTLSQAGPFGTTKSITMTGSSYLMCNSFVLSNYTLECWVNFSAIGGQIPVYNGNPSTNGNGMVVFSSTFQGLAGGVGFEATGVTPSTGTWYHMVYTRSGNTDTFYVNNSSLGSFTTFAAAVSGSNFGVGVGTNPITGSISNVALYPAPLSTTRIAAHFAARLD